ncbi:SUKH-4 family immunity protein [Saccharopolyspora kobensis]|uniref:SUKH-4 family immunity protein n=1 Tax=Saccharopolyspora kobensis TaxID=146035 RepID=UPI000B8491B2|nr:SUKH-4 family immunity protein [Saccharopolyspora kobensis]
MDLLPPLRQFTDAFGRNDGNPGRIALRPRAADVPGLPPGPFRDYLAAVEIEDSPVIGGLLGLQLFSHHELAKAQDGWSTVWANGQPQPNPAWQQSWIVFGDVNGDAVVADTGDQACPVFGSVQQHNSPLAPDLGTFFAAVTAVMRWEAARELDTHDEDFNLLPEVPLELYAALSAHLDPVLTDDFLGFFLD